MAEWHIGQIVRILKAGDSEPYIGIITSDKPGPGPTICVFPRAEQDNYFSEIPSAVIVVPNVPDAGAGWSNGWLPLP